MSEELRKFVVPEFVFGHGARRLSGRYASNLGAHRVLLVSDPGVREAGWTEEIRSELEESGLMTRLFDGVTSNPRASEVDAGVEAYLAHGCDAIVAVGGGSPMDCAKGIAILARNGGRIHQYEGVDRVPKTSPPLLCIPTTAGSSADVSQFAIFSLPEEGRKIAIISKAVVPDASLVDPACTHTMDRFLTASTGMDALAHALEALVSNASSPLTDLHARAGARGVFRHLGIAMKDLENPVAREQLMLASLQAGLAFSNASLGLLHAMAHAIGGQLDSPHGECNAELLPYVVAFNYEAAAEEYGRLSRDLGLPSSHAEPSAPLTQALFDLQREVGMNRGLASLGIRKEDIPRLASSAMRDPCIVTNPRTPSQTEVEALYAQAL